MPRKDYSYIQPGYKFPNSCITAIGTVWRERDKTPSATLRAYVNVRCECGNEFVGRVDRLTTTDPTKSPHTCRCVECAKKGKKKLLPTSWDYKAKSTAENVVLKNNYLGKIFDNTWFCATYAGGDHQGHSSYICINQFTGQTQIFKSMVLYHMNCDDSLAYTTQPSQRSYSFEDEAPTSNESSGEAAVKQWLINHKIQFEQEYTFDNLRGDRGLLRFDFKIKDRPIVIEFQGQQHYKAIDYFGGEDQFKKQQRYDNIKRAYCKANKIDLIEIPYNYIDLNEYLNHIKLYL